MPLVSPQQVASALLALQPEQLTPIQPLEQSGSAPERTIFHLPVLALLRVLTQPHGDFQGLPKPNIKPKGGLGSYTKQFTPALCLVLESCQSHCVELGQAKAKVVKADGMNNVKRIDEHKLSIAENLVRRIANFVTVVTATWPDSCVYSFWQGFPPPDASKPNSAPVGGIVTFTFISPGPLPSQLPEAICDHLHEAASAWTSAEPGDSSNKIEQTGRKGKVRSCIMLQLLHGFLWPN